MYIVIAGNIGSGKTTLTNMLVKHYGWTPRMESVQTNPYLDDYYKDMKRWSLNLETFFLKERFRDLLEIEKSEATIIQDRSIFEGVFIFTANNHDMGNMSDRDFDTYMGLFQSMMLVLRKPDLLDYLRNLNQRYDDFIENQYDGKTLTIEVDNIDFLHKREDFASVIKQIDKSLIEIKHKNDNKLCI